VLPINYPSAFGLEGEGKGKNQEMPSLESWRRVRKKKRKKLPLLYFFLTHWSSWA